MWTVELEEKSGHQAWVQGGNEGSSSGTGCHWQFWSTRLIKLPLAEGCEWVR